MRQDVHNSRPKSGTGNACVLILGVLLQLRTCLATHSLPANEKNVLRPDLYTPFLSAISIWQARVAAHFKARNRSCFSSLRDRP